MSEMLGNRYFLTRQFNKATFYLEKALRAHPHSHEIKKKLVICYIQNGKIEQALSIFHDLVNQDANIIIDTDPYYDDCPCQEIIPGWERLAKHDNFPQHLTLILGMLYLYCDLNKSILYLRKAHQENPDNSKISSVLKVLAPLQESEE